MGRAEAVEDRVGAVMSTDLGTSGGEQQAPDPERADPDMGECVCVRERERVSERNVFFNYYLYGAICHQWRSILRQNGGMEPTKERERAFFVLPSEIRIPRRCLLVRQTFFAVVYNLAHAHAHAHAHACRRSIAERLRRHFGSFI